jgi:hypothetical protein
MKLTFIYQSAADLPAALAFYRDELGLDEAWREGESTVAFELPGSSVQLMLDTRPDDNERWTSGAFFQVDDVVAFTQQHPDIRWVGEVIDLPDGRSAALPTRPATSSTSSTSKPLTSTRPDAARRRSWRGEADAGVRRSCVMSGSCKSEADSEGGQGSGGIAAVVAERGGEVDRPNVAEHTDR